MRTADLTGAPLDCWVARAEGVPADQLEIRPVQRPDPRTPDTICVWVSPSLDEIIGRDEIRMQYSTSWHMGGPLVEKYRLDLDFDSKRGWSAATEDVVHWMHADDVLTAICRTVVCAAFGDEVEDLPCV